MYYLGDRYTAVVYIVIASAYFILTALATYTCFDVLSPDKCKIIDSVNLTDGKTWDIAFYVNSTSGIDLAFGTDFYYISNTYNCYRFMQIMILDNGKSYISFVLGLSMANTVFAGILALVAVCRTIYIYRVTREFSYISA